MHGTSNETRRGVALATQPNAISERGRSVRQNGGNPLRRAGKFLLHFDCEFPAKAAGALQRLGLHGAAETLLWRVYCANPYDCSLGEHLANMIYDRDERSFADGTVERGRFIMKTLERSYPSARVTAAYRHNLEELLKRRERRERPGQVVLGLGAGRCGSTTLAAILHSIDGAVSTHENPPEIYWQPLPAQMQFHISRFRIFSQYCPLVADCAHWWINALDTVFDAFPASKAIALHRDTDDCVRSWMRVSPPDVNHWVAPYNGIWPADRWDPLYPHYELPAGARRDPRRAKEELAYRYVTEYNERLETLAARMPERVLLLRTEDLDLPATRRRISEFLDMTVGLSALRLNVDTDSDAPSADELYF